MTVYGVNMTNRTEQTDDFEQFISDQFSKTGRASLINQDFKKWGNRVFNLTIGELVERFELSYNDSLSHVRKYFKSEGLKVKPKYHYSNNLYDYPIKEE